MDVTSSRLGNQRWNWKLAGNDNSLINTDADRDAETAHWRRLANNDICNLIWIENKQIATPTDIISLLLLRVQTNRWQVTGNPLAVVVMNL